MYSTPENEEREPRCPPIGIRRPSVQPRYQEPNYEDLSPIQGVDDSQPRQQRYTPISTQERPITSTRERHALQEPLSNNFEDLSPIQRVDDGRTGRCRERRFDPRLTSTQERRRSSTRERHSLQEPLSDQFEDLSPIQRFDDGQTNPYRERRFDPRLNSTRERHRSSTRERHSLQEPLSNNFEDLSPIQRVDDGRTGRCRERRFDPRLASTRERHRSSTRERHSLQEPLSDQFEDLNPIQGVDDGQRSRNTHPDDEGSLYRRDVTSEEDEHVHEGHQRPTRRLQFSNLSPSIPLDHRREELQFRRRYREYWTPRRVQKVARERTRQRFNMPDCLLTPQSPISPIPEEFLYRKPKLFPGEELHKHYPRERNPPKEQPPEAPMMDNFEARKREETKMSYQDMVAKIRELKDFVKDHTRENAALVDSSKFQERRNARLKEERCQLQEKLLKARSELYQLEGEYQVETGIAYS